MCVLKLFAAAEGTESVNAVRDSREDDSVPLSFSLPACFLSFGWVRWWRVRPPRYWRSYAIAWGLTTASISALCLYGVLSYVQLAHIGHSDEHRLAIAGVYVGCPLSVFSVVAAVVGNGRSRVIAWLAGGLLAVVWTVAFFYA